MRNRAFAVVGAVMAVAFFAAGCTSSVTGASSVASDVKVTSSVPSTVTPSSESPQHVDPPSASASEVPSIVVPTPGVTIQVYPTPDGGDIVDTVCGNAIGTFEGTDELGARVTTVSGAARAVLGVSSAVAVDDQWRFHIPKPAANKPAVITSVSALHKQDLAPQVDDCNRRGLLVEDSEVTKQVDDIVGKPLVICEMRFYNTTYVAVTTVDGATYLAPFKPNRNILPGETVTFEKADSASIRAVDFTPVNPESCASYAL